MWNQGEGKWMAAEGVKVLAVGNSQVNVSGATPSTCNMHTDKLGDFERLKGQEVNGTALYSRKDSDMRLWQASGNWYIGPASKARKADPNPNPNPTLTLTLALALTLALTLTPTVAPSPSISLTLALG